MNEFPKEMVNAIKKKIDQSLEALDSPAVAAFDADGTLWSFDLGEEVFNYQLKNKLLPELRPDAWEYYEEIHESDPPKAFLWLAQINAGLPLDQLRNWAQQALEACDNIPLFEAQKEIIQHLHDKEVKVYVVTASIKWAVEPGAKLYGIPEDRVIGVQTKVIDGIISDEQQGPITWREGKVKGLLEATGGVLPFFTAGNTSGDLPLLDSASHIRLVLASAEPNHGNYETEQKMQALAKDRNWFHHSYL